MEDKCHCNDVFIVTEVSSNVSDAEFWLQSTATAVSSTHEQPTRIDPFHSATSNARMNGQHPAPPVPTPLIDPFTGQPLAPAPVAPPAPAPVMFPVQHHTPPPRVPAAHHHAPHLAAQGHLRSHSMDSATPPHPLPTSTSSAIPPPATNSPWTASIPEPAKNDPFDAAWNSRTPNRPGTTGGGGGGAGVTNPFQAQKQQQQPGEPAFTVNM